MSCVTVDLFTFFIFVLFIFEIMYLRINILYGLLKLKYYCENKGIECSI